MQSCQELVGKFSIDLQCKYLLPRSFLPVHGTGENFSRFVSHLTYYACEEMLNKLVHNVKEAAMKIAHFRTQPLGIVTINP